MAKDFAAMLPLSGETFGNSTSGYWRATVLEIQEPRNSDQVGYVVQFAQTKVGTTGQQSNRTLRLVVSHAGLAHSTYNPDRSDSYQTQIFCRVGDWISKGSTTPELYYFGT